MDVRAWCDHTAWYVDVDGVRRVTLPYVRYGQNACFLAARIANDYRLED